MKISNFGRLIGAGLLALGMYAIAPSANTQSLAAGPPTDELCLGHCDADVRRPGRDALAQEDRLNVKAAAAPSR
jgi:hypothetical protein